jgi:hypothetical protein
VELEVCDIVADQQPRWVIKWFFCSVVRIRSSRKFNIYMIPLLVNAVTLKPCRLSLGDTKEAIREFLEAGRERILFRAIQFCSGRRHPLGRVQDNEVAMIGM